MTKKQTRYILFFCVFSITIIVVVYFYFFNQFWTHLTTEHFNTLIEYRGERIKGYRGRQILINREFLNIMKQVELYAEKNDIILVITQSYRPPQKKLKNTVVKPASNSNHLAGHAIDFNPVCRHKLYESKDMMQDKRLDLPEEVKQFIKDIQADKEMRWGGDFKTEDPIHIDDRLNRKDIKKWEQHYNGCVNDYMNAERKYISILKKIFNRYDNVGKDE